ncbi:MAG: SMC-Scp complex subunit ScpB [Candidatus Latescibacterota bacterium]
MPVEPGKARAIIEAVLLTAEDPVPPARLTALLDGLNGRQVKGVVEDLRQEYQEAGRGFTIVEVAGGYQLATREDLGPWLHRFHRDHGQVRLSQAALETLAIIAFRQPVTRVEVDSIRGVSSAGVLQHLMELGMVRIVGRSEGLGRPMLFGTTQEFLIHFQLRNLTDLPKPRELEELLREGEEKARQRQGAAAATPDGLQTPGATSPEPAVADAGVAAAGPGAQGESSAEEPALQVQAALDAGSHEADGRE